MQHISRPLRRDETSKEAAFPAYFYGLFFGSVLASGIAITSFQFWNLYPEASFFTKLLVGPAAFHFVILELLVAAGLCHFFLILFRRNSVFHLATFYLAASLMVILFSLFFIQFCSLYLSNDYLTVSALTSSTQVGLVVSPFLTAALAVTVVLPSLVVILSWKRAAPQMRQATFSTCLKPFGFHVFLALATMQSYHLRWMRDVKWDYPAQRTPPAQALLGTIQQYLAHASISELGVASAQDLDGARELRDDDRAKLAEFGIKVDIGQPYPLIKDRLYLAEDHIDDFKQGFEEPRTGPLGPQTNPTRHPQDRYPWNDARDRSREKLNVIIIFAESLSARLLGAYGGNFPQLTPNIDQFARDSLFVKGYVNHAFPTIPALTGTLCSIFPQFSHTDWNRAKSKLRLPPLYCLPKLLTDEGYTSIYLGYSHPRETFFRDQMLDFGFQNALFYEELSRNLLNEDPEHGALGNSDHQMFSSLRAVLEKRREETPFFLALSTIGTHVGMDSTKRGQKYGDGSIPTLNTFHHFDHEFGSFYRWFQGSRYAKNTILILTADHAHPPSREFASLVKKNTATNYKMFPFDFIPLIIRDPRSDQQSIVEVQGTSLDFAPTLTQILKIPHRRHHFLGQSLFDLQASPMPRIGIVDGGRMLLYRENQMELEDIDLVTCIKRQSSDEPCQLARGLAFIFSQMKQTKLWTTELERSSKEASNRTPPP